MNNNQSPIRTVESSSTRRTPPGASRSVPSHGARATAAAARGSLALRMRKGLTALLILGGAAFLVLSMFTPIQRTGAAVSRVDIEPKSTLVLPQLQLKAALPRVRSSSPVWLSCNASHVSDENVFDMACPDHDELRNNAGCQIRCGGGRDARRIRLRSSAAPSAICARAVALCEVTSHCIGVRVRGAWGTLKTTAANRLPPKPVCAGHAFEQHLSGATVRLPAVDEERCFAHTGVDRAQALATRTKAGRDGATCDMRSCFDLARCVVTGGPSAFALKPALLFVGEEPAQSADLRRLPACLRATFNASLSPSASSACMVWPTVNLNCEYDRCSGRTAALLHASAGWGHRGRNHLIYDHVDAAQTPYHVGEAILLKTSMRASDYRPGFDVPYPLPPMGVHQVRHRADNESRPLLLSFKGSCRRNRAKYSAWHDGIDVVIICTDRQQGRDDNRGDQLELQGYQQERHELDYHELALRSRFALTPAGNGLHSVC